MRPEEKSHFRVPRRAARGRIVGWEADPRHVEKILEVCGMTSGNPSVLPGEKIVGGGRRRSTTRGRRGGQVQVCCSDGELHRSRSPRCEVRCERALHATWPSRHLPAGGR